MTAVSRRKSSRSSSGAKSRSQILWKQAVEARVQWPSLLRRPELIWLVLRKTALQHAILAAAIIGIQLGTGDFVGMIGEFLQLEPGAPTTWMAAGTACATFVWGVGIWLSTPRVLNFAALRARGLAIRADHRAKEDPELGLELYREALGKLLSSQSRSEIRRKIKALEAAQAAAQSDTEPNHTAEGAASLMRNAATVVKPFEPSESQAETDVETVGPDGRYLLHREIGRGGMAVVFHATDQVLGRDVALKQLPTQMCAEKELTDRFRQEARALASLSHPNVVQIFDLFDHDGQLWIAMELTRGGDLADQMDRQGAYSLRQAFEIVVPIAGGLAAAHARGIIHRDIKPMNILIAEDLTPKLTDFGLAKLIETSVHTVAGVAMGSPPYMSPEQAGGKVADKATDMYSLGITLYELLSTRTPFEGDMSQVMAQHITQPPPPLTDFCPELAPDISQLVASMLEKDPKLRPGDMGSFVASVRALGALDDT